VQDRPNMYIATGYASRGVGLAALLAETLASMICDEPLPLERDLVKAMDSGRR
jgi:tRNA 5-methylaminomethyl-2-thiouridine biosynthesis bifunctional protein